MSEISDAVQIIRVTYEGIEIAMKVGSGSIELMQKAVDLIVGMLNYEKTMGKTNLNGMLKKGGDIQVVSFADEELKKFSKMAKKYGILYSVMPDAGRNDGLTEVMFHSEAAPRMRMMCQKMNHARIFNIDEYLKNGNEEQLNKLLEHLQKEKKGNQGLHTEQARAFDEAIDGLIEKVGSYAMEKSAISVEDIKTDFKMEADQAKDVMDKLATIGLIEHPDEHGMCKVVMDKDSFDKRVGKYQALTNRMRQIAASKNTNLLDITITKKLIVEENDHAIKTEYHFTCDWHDTFGVLWISRSRSMERGH